MFENYHKDLVKIFSYIINFRMCQKTQKEFFGCGLWISLSLFTTFWIYGFEYFFMSFEESKSLFLMIAGWYSCWNLIVFTKLYPFMAVIYAVMPAIDDAMKIV